MKMGEAEARLLICQARASVATNVRTVRKYSTRDSPNPQICWHEVTSHNFQKRQRLLKAMDLDKDCYQAVKAYYNGDFGDIKSFLTSDTAAEYGFGLEDPS